MALLTARIFLCCTFAILALTVAVKSQESSNYKPSQTPIPIEMSEHEGESRATWTFLGAQGTGEWDSGEFASLYFTKVKRNDDDTFYVEIHRADTRGTSAGLEADYKGTWKNGSIIGTYSSRWKNHQEGYKTDAPWYAQTEGPIARPGKINMCILHCFVLTLQNGHYVNVAPQNTSTYTVVSFTRESVIFHRIDRGSFPLTADLTGRISSDGEHIYDGSIVWTSGNSGSGRFQASWGSHIGDTPESDVERQRRMGSGGQSQSVNPDDVRLGIRFFTAVLEFLNNHNY